MKTALNRRKPRKVDAFGESENLEQAVDNILNEEELPGRSTVSDEEILVIYKEGTGPSQEVNFFPVFEMVYNPEEGYFADAGVTPDFRIKSITRFPIGWGTDYRRVEESFLAGDEIDEIQQASVEESFHQGYSEERFRELYEEAIN